MSPCATSPSRASSPWGLVPCIAMLSGASHAQRVSPAVLDPVVVTASRSPQRLLDLVADVTVIDADEIARGGAQGLVALLSRQPGVEIIQNGGPGSTSGVFLRGAN